MSTTTLRSTVLTAINNGVQLVKWTWKEFAQNCLAQGFTQYNEFLTRPEGKFPFIGFLNPATNAMVTVMLGKEVAKMLIAGTMPVEALKTLTVVDGKNGKQEQRYYLSRNGFSPITVEEAIAHCEAYQAKVAKLNEAKLQALIS